MKKLMIVAAAAAISAGATAADLDAQVYDVSMTVKSTACKEIKYTKTIATLEGDSWDSVKGGTISVRKQGSTKIAGVIWGCECETFADPDWRLYNGGKTVGGYLFWNVGAEEIFNIYTTYFKWAAFNRIDKGEKVEGAWLLREKTKDNVVFFLGAGFGKVNGLDCRETLTSMSGNFAGFLLAGSSAGGCAFCGDTDCTAWQVCPCTTQGTMFSYPLDMTVAYGSWKIKYNKSASKKLRSTGRISTAYKFKKAGNAKDLMTHVENAALKGLISASDDNDYWEDGEGGYYITDKEGEPLSTKVAPASVAAFAYEKEALAGDGEEPEDYEGDLPALVSSLLDAVEELDNTDDAS